MADPRPDNPIHSSYGEQLLGELAREKAGLPTKTLFTLVLGGLRVRLMRSAVTVVSVVLAIAFFTYAGLFSYLTLNLAQGVDELERVEGVSSNEVSAAATALEEMELIDRLERDQRRSLARSIELHRVRDERVALGNLRDDRRDLVGQRAAAADALADLEQADDATPVEIEAARETLERRQARLDDLDTELAVVEAKVELGEWLQDGGDDPAMEQRLAQVLREHQQQLLQRAVAVSMSPADLEALDRVVTLAQAHGADSAALETFDRLIASERARHNVTELRQRFSAAGIGVQATLDGEAADWWLIIMALLTCAVGIANAMLMSVTERFREIGTMKCLGAPDGLVVKLFLLESSFLGMIGAALGIVLGVLVALGAAVLQFGGFGIVYFPRVDAGMVVAGSVAAGILLAVIGAVYPAFVAARMNPVDALRVEE